MQNLTVLVTGFEPFGGAQLNASEQVLRRLPASISENGCTIQLQKERLAVSGEEVQNFFEHQISIDSLSAILCLGESAKISTLCLERVALNLKDYPIQDNRGQQPRNAYIKANAPAAYFSDLPLTAIASAVRTKAVPVTISNHAGTYVCNEAMYTSLYCAAKSEVPSGFIHIPIMPEQCALRGIGSPSMSVETSTRGVLAALHAIAAFLLNKREAP